MSSSREKQGFLEDLDSMSIPQLKDLLERQEKILSRTKFVASLPDKGKKCQQFAEKLRDLLAVRIGSDIPSNNFSPLQRNNGRIQDEYSSKMSDIDHKTIKNVVIRNEADVTYSSETPETNAAEDLAHQMEELSVGSKRDVDTQQMIPSNSYERVIKKVEESPLGDKVKFLPHKTKKDKCSSSHQSPGTKPKSSKVYEESAVYPPSYNHESTKLISVEESVQLIQEQRLKAEQIAAERAAQRLAEHFSTKMDTYQPPSVDMRYRQAKKIDDDDDDEDENNDDVDNDDDDKNIVDSDDIPSDDEDAGL